MNKEFEVRKEEILRIPYSFAKKNNVIFLKEAHFKIYIGIDDPLNIEPINELRLFFNKEIESVKIEKSKIEKIIEEYYLEKREEKKEKSFEQSDYGYDLLDKSESNSAVNILNSIILEAVSQKASDIHFEPLADSLSIRYRIDGVLQKKPSVSKDMQSQIITRIKVISKLDIAEKRLPQDGRIKLFLNKREVDFRISTIPTINGERVVLRILDKTNIVFGFETLIQDVELVKTLKHDISIPEGIILVTGPTGSGKTTTLYSAISELDFKKLNIMTIEDPVEYKLNEISQIAINPKIDLTFAKGLKHILRQDPDIIMVGEIRDKETAQIAIQAALTGHLVLSTLHTNDSPSAIARLVDMGIEPYLISTTVVSILAQRLLRKLCEHCKKEYEPEGATILNYRFKKRKYFKAEGCEKCFYTGYNGRIGIYEYMKLDKNIKRQLLINADANEIKNVLPSDYKTLLKSAFEIFENGQTSIDEIFRVTRTI
ncbi:MAG: hypothetical protein A2888_01550 [Chlamydiae bacterium RIFCSPLOWO2_01_FULL_28_7]|nr:MAG: hypothetical protein A2888_01550 [Chlamydiae bacterium RIFCSPLOWO2_01_FULL_28_7]